MSKPSPTRDLRVTVEGVVFEVNRSRMAEHCDYFGALFRSGMRECQRDELEITGCITANGFSIMLRVLDDGATPLRADDVVDAVEAAGFLQVSALVAYLSAAVDSDNCVEMLVAASEYGVERARRCAAHFVRDVLDEPRFASRLSLLSEEHRLHVSALQPSRLSAVGTYSSSNAYLDDKSRTVCCLDEVHNRWEVVTALPRSASSALAGIAVLNNKLYLVGGIRGMERDPVETTFCYDPLRRVWRELAGPIQPRYNLALLAHRDRLLAIGGEHGGIKLATVESFDERAEAWSPCAPLPQAAAGAACATTLGRAFVCLWKPLDTTTISELDADGEAWRRLATLVKPHSYGHCMVAHRDNLYVIRNGPYDDFLHCAIDRYNISSAAWTTLAGQYMNSKGALFSSVVKGDRVFTLNRMIAMPYAIEAERWRPLPAFAGFPRGGTLHTFLLRL
ncbi:kelch repeat and BTB domain-containing protein 13 [Lampetra fluviatilis]